MRPAASHHDGGDTPRDGPFELSLSLESILSLLADRDRRHLLDHLANAGEGTHRIEACARHLVERAEPRTGDARRPERVAMDLHHAHLPRLEDAGVVAYDPASGEIRYDGDDRLEEWTERVIADERR